MTPSWCEDLSGHPYPFLALKISPDRSLEEKNLTAQDPEETERRFLRCRNCKGRVTTLESAREVAGQHCHTFFNPAGICFRIGCFSTAEGCLVHGAPTRQHSWFAGFRWCFALCSHCVVHLGWHYQAERGEDFFGLILSKLEEDR